MATQAPDQKQKWPDLIGSKKQKGDCRATVSRQMFTISRCYIRGSSLALSTLAYLLVFRVDTSSFLAGAVTTLAFFVAFSELIKLFFSIVINYTSNIWIAD